MKTIYVTVYYFDSLAGGSGMERVELLLLASWLADRPGVLIRRLEMPLFEGT